jgi:hypothetical protein
MSINDHQYLVQMEKRHYFYIFSGSFDVVGVSGQDQRLFAMVQREIECLRKDLDPSPENPEETTHIHSNELATLLTVRKNEMEIVLSAGIICVYKRCLCLLIRDPN